MKAYCKCGNGVFIVKVDGVTPDEVAIRYECTLCDHEVVYLMSHESAELFCAGLRGSIEETPPDRSKLS